MELTEDFLKLLIVAIAIVGILAIFFIFVQYNIIISYNDAHREAVVLGDAILASDCLTEIKTVNGEEYPIKGLFLESKLDAEVDRSISGTGSCIKYDKGVVNIKLLEDHTEKWDFNIMPTTKRGGKTKYIVAVKLDSEDVKLGLMEVEV